MKNLFKSFMLVAIVAAAFAGCSTDDTSDIQPVIPDKGVTVTFDADVEETTRVNLEPIVNPDNGKEETFHASWLDGDKIGTFVTTTTGGYSAANVSGEYNDGSFKATFTGDVPEGPITTAKYRAYYPYSATTYKYTDEDINRVSISFGKERTQKGNEYPGQYDIMLSDPETVKNSPIGMNGANKLQFHMHRQTSIVYFHFQTTDEHYKNETVRSAKLSITTKGNNNSNEYLAANYIRLNLVNSTDPLIRRLTQSKEITMGFENGTNPTAEDFKLWFNVTPCVFETMTLEIETDHYKTKITRKTVDKDGNPVEGKYEIGKLYRIAATDKLQWEAKEHYEGTYLILAKVKSGNYWYLTPEPTTKNDRLTAKDSKKSAITDYDSAAVDFPDATNDLAWTIERADKGHYNIKSVSTGMYIWGPSASSNTAKLSATDKEDVWITKNADNTYKIAASSIEEKYLARNSQSSNEYFAFYADGQIDDLVLIPYKPVPVITTNVTSVKDIPAEGGTYDEGITYELSNFETTPEVNVTCDREVVTEAIAVDGNIMYTVSANTTYEVREGWIKLSAEGAKDVTITVTQKKAQAEPTVYALVTAASDPLAEGDKVIIVAATANYAMSTEQKTNNRGQADIVKNNGEITILDEHDTNVQLFLLEKGTKNDTFAFKTVNGTNTGYIYASSSSSNYLQTETTLSANSSWTISIDNTTNNATITAQGTNTRNVLQYNNNSTNKLFACYASASQAAVQIYRLKDTRKPLGKPEINVDANHKDKSIYVLWDAVPNATLYEVSCTGQTITKTDTTTACEYTFTGLDYGEYTISVKATADGYRPASASATAKIVNYNLAAPTITAISGTVDEINASWNVVPDATSYTWELYKGTDNSGQRITDEVLGEITTKDKVVSLLIVGEFEKDAQYALYVKSAAYAPFIGAESEPAVVMIQEEVVVEYVTESVTFSQLGYSNAADVTTIKIGDATLTFDKGSNSNAPKYYTTGSALRAYGGNTITFTGGTFTKIIFTENSGKTKAMTVSDGTKLNADTSITWTGEQSNLTFTIDGTSGQAQITKIEVTYIK